MRNAPWWKKSSPIQVSVIGACGDTALMAGCGVMPTISVSQPGYEMPSAPTRPLFPRTFLSSQSIVSDVSVVSSRPLPFVHGRFITNSPCDLLRPRMSWNTKM